MLVLAIFPVEKKKMLSGYTSSMISTLGAKGDCFGESYLYILTALQN